MMKMMSMMMMMMMKLQQCSKKYFGQWQFNSKTQLTFYCRVLWSPDVDIEDDDDDDEVAAVFEKVPWTMAI